MARLKSYYWLTKPGIIYGNALSAAAGFFLASQGKINFGLLLAVLGGSSLVIASACVYNNYIDRDIDKKMERTKKRALVSGEISGRSALVFATILGAAGFLVLLQLTNIVTVLVGVVGFVDYVVAYGITKRQGAYGTLVGSIAGATPIVAGYTSASGQLDGGAGLLFLIMALWQMPHFYAIALRRHKEYAAAGLPVLPVTHSSLVVRRRILLYVIAFSATSLLLTGFGYTGYVYLSVMIILGGRWLQLAIQGFGVSDTTIWAKQMFGFSLIVLLGFCLMISLNAWLP